MINTNSEIHKVVLAYSGGLDTSVILIIDSFNYHSAVHIISFFVILKLEFNIYWSGYCI